VIPPQARASESTDPGERIKPRLPPGYTWVKDLAGAARARVVLAERDGSKVVLRLEHGSTERDAPERHAELAVLAGVKHPGLAALIDYGPLPAELDGSLGNGTFVARTWIEGQDLSTWARARPDGSSRSPEELGELVARMCPALEELHARGFLHADLKGDNVIVRENGRPVLTDFGLARRSGSQQREVSGTLFALAPEVLLGGSADARSDLFALGVLLHQLLAGRRASAREFYARFPAEDFFAAAGSDPSELPDWARDLVASLVARDPNHRPASALAVGRLLASRLGVAELERELAAVPVSLRWPTRFGRESWFEGLAERLLVPSGQALPVTWVALAPGEDARAVSNEVALLASLAGARVQRHDLEVELANVRDATSLEFWTRDALSGAAPDVLHFAALGLGAAPWHVRAAEALGRSASAQGTRVVLFSSGIHPPADLEHEFHELGLANAEAIEHFLAERMPEEELGRRVGFAKALHTATGGAPPRIEQVLRCARDQGWILSAGTGVRLRPGPVPARLEVSADAAVAGRELSADARGLLAALQVCEGRAELEMLAKLVELDDAAFARAVHELAQSRLAQMETAGTPTELGLDPALGPVDPAVIEEATWRRLFELRADQLEGAGASRAKVLALRFRAGLSDSKPLVRETEELRDRGLPELALEACEWIASEQRRSRIASDPAVEGQRALSWVAVGDLERALAVVEALAPAGRPAVQSIVERVRGRVAMHRHEHARALEHFERGLALDPDDGGEALLANVQLLYDTRRDAELCALAGEPAGTSRAGMRPRVRHQIANFHAMSLLRLGEITSARGILQAELGDARRQGDPSREAGLRMNLGTLERRAGELSAALAHLEQAVKLAERSGALPQLAQARALHGAALREAGELARAEPLLASALEIRLRLGDLAGASAVRGMLGPLLAERGRARAALAELERSASDLRRAGRASDAALLDAQRDEVLARLGTPPRPGAERREVARAAEGDPRVLLALSRAQALLGAKEAALALAGRARELGRSLGLTSVQEEAQFLERVLTHPREAFLAPSDTPTEGASLCGQDVLLLHLLSQPKLEEARVRAMARDLATRGREARAARCWIALAARASDRTAVDEAAQEAGRLLELCATGTSPEESAALRRSLLQIPDPWPEDLSAAERAAATPEESEMEVLSLLEINHRLLAKEDLGSLLGAIVEHALAVCGAERGFLVLEEDGELRFDTALDSRRGDIRAPDVEVSRSVLKEALEKMRPLRVSNAIDDPLLAQAPSVIALELRSVLCVPFKVERGLRGVIYVDHRLREGAFAERAERMLGLLADQAALAILQVRRLEEIKRLNQRLSREKVHVESDLRTAKKALQNAGLPAPGGGLVGNSLVMRDVHRLLERCASTRLTVLVCGPSGTGKELAARALHDLSPRAGGPFVSENCAALPATLIESELFGARRGAFTGAERDREGLFERAHGGTLFLDEIGELPLELQAKLLRVLETSQVRRLGDNEERKVDFRLVAATNRDLDREVREGRFRQDLFYRLEGLRIEMPPLSARTEDIPALVDHYLRLQAGPGEEPRRISKAVLARLSRREWPGNVRELFNELARLCVVCEGEIEDPTLVRAANLGLAPSSPGTVQTLSDLEREAIHAALRATGGDKRRAAHLLGISRAKIYQRLKEWGEVDQVGAEDAEET
jgi:transcriptional regulator with GAF, ATPase, and Fis domain/tetratricopeptide (TPR) repeat protein